MSNKINHQRRAKAIQKEIDKDKSIGPKEARLIHALLKGRHGGTK